jgi:hypothetical protein
VSAQDWCEPCGFYHPRSYDCSASRERDQAAKRLLDAAQDAYRRGYADGHRDGAEQQWKERQAAAIRLDPAAPSLAELELLRWGCPREWFGDPRPADRIITGRAA